MSRRNIPLEASVVAKILAKLKTYPNIVVRKRHGTAMGKAGDPDLYGILDGQHFEIEVKRPGDPSSQLTALQVVRLEEWKGGGAITGVARTVLEALAILGLDHEKVGLPLATWLCTGCRAYRWESDTPPARCPACRCTRFEKEAACVLR